MITTVANTLEAMIAPIKVTTNILAEIPSARNRSNKAFIFKEYGTAGFPSRPNGKMTYGIFFVPSFGEVRAKAPTVVGLAQVGCGKLTMLRIIIARAL